MNEKKNTAKFTIQFNPEIATHLKAIKILNSISPRGKAQIITDALLMYNAAYGLIDVTNTDDLVINTPKYQSPASDAIKKAVSEDNYHDDTLVLEYDNVFDENDSDDTDENEHDSVYDSIFAQSLQGMGFNNSGSEDT